MICPECGSDNPSEVRCCQWCLTALPPASVPASPTADDNERPKPPGRAFLVRSSGGRWGDVIELCSDLVRIGRAADADVFLDDVTVARYHAVVLLRDDGHHIEDLGSVNGTYVNRYVVRSHRLQDGDELQIGKYKLMYMQR